MVDDKHKKKIDRRGIWACVDLVLQLLELIIVFF